jgi:hypothetical protein
MRSSWKHRVAGAKICRKFCCFCQPASTFCRSPYKRWRQPYITSICRQRVIECLVCAGHRKWRRGEISRIGLFGIVDWEEASLTGGQAPPSLHLFSQYKYEWNTEVRLKGYTSGMRVLRRCYSDFYWQTVALFWVPDLRWSKISEMYTVF